MKRKFVSMTPSMHSQLRDVFAEQRLNRGSIFAQVFEDGLHVVVLPDEVAIKVSNATGDDYREMVGSAKEAFLDGIRRDQETILSADDMKDDGGSRAGGAA